MSSSRYYEELAAAFVRGRLGNAAATIDDGLRAGLRLHKFKADATLARVQKVLGILRAVGPESLLDVGSGRGTFLWPLLDAFPGLAVTSIDISDQRILDLRAVRDGGVTRLTPVLANAQEMPFAGGSFDVVTMLEVLEHMVDPQAALTRAVAVARRFVILSVPSVPDDNPEHIHLFSVDDLRHMADVAGARRVTIDHVLNHRIAVLQ
ncbi:MAG: class I SAM-dependent methyltransferase [Acidobacteria bacterium]|nr:class I SAM-dependent methyltransferase [Acidobacteriota bacterium]